MNLNAELYLNLIRGGAARLAQKRQEINDLNVFPIPDGDTGDNMYMTIQAGARSQVCATLGATAETISREMLLGARGNSGVILSRIFAGMGKAFQGLQEADINAFTVAMRTGVKEAYHAVSQPVEGTILTVLREGVEAAEGAAGLEDYLDRWIPAMEKSLEHTPQLLDVLKKAGVVDSGGAGLLCIAEGMREALHGRSPVMAGDDAKAGADVMAGPDRPSIDFNAFTEDSELEFGYCTEFLLRLQRCKVDLDSFDESVIRRYLETRGDSLVFFRDGSIVKVHVHTQDPGAVLSHCRQWGEFLTVKVENMTLQHHENHMDRRFKRARKSLGIVTVATGDGLVNAFREMGADAVIAGGQTMNPPVERFLEAFDQANADTILVFPNNSNIILTARQAAEIYKASRIEVIPTKTPGEGYYSLANLDAEQPLETIRETLAAAARSVTTGQISRAIRDTADAREGDYIGFSGKEILCSCPDRPGAVLSLAEKLLAGEKDVLILFSGADAPEQEARSLQSQLEKQYPLTEVILHDGGQPVYDYLLVMC